MADKYYNPFSGITINVPKEYHGALDRYCRSGGRAIIDHSPFERMVDMWMLSACVAARLGLEEVDIPQSESRKIIDGTIFGSDPWRVHILMLLAIGRSGDVGIVSEPNKMLNIANGLAGAGLPKVIEMLGNGTAEPIWNLSEEVAKLIGQ